MRKLKKTVICQFRVSEGQDEVVFLNFNLHGRDQRKIGLEPLLQGNFDILTLIYLVKTTFIGGYLKSTPQISIWLKFK